MVEHGEGFVDVPAAQCVEGSAFGRVLLAAVLE
jgi:hypothetical protein